MRSHPIWNNVTACNYASSKSWGSRDAMSLTQFVGSSASNSHEFCDIATTRRTTEIEGIEYISFVLWVDQKPVKQAIFSHKNGYAKDLICKRKLRCISDIRKPFRQRKAA